ncbi:unnamed protein product [Spirodela intermedia]|uniref:Retrotransposon gag domain-containing protein n=1 Tax=Spirodela intermedia TaxID=51605 RepID=A0A7I8K8I4_SPIIN|nr:unnamed protein product [Spirodela intermedia]
MLMRKIIMSFTQNSNEPLHEAWYRFKAIVRRYPHHGIPKWQIIQIFYDGLCSANKQMIDASWGGTFMNKNEDEGYSLLEELSENSSNYVSSSSFNRSKGGIYEIRKSDDKEWKKSYKPRWRNHPNFSWKNQNMFSQPHPSNFQAHQPLGQGQQVMGNSQDSDNKLSAIQQLLQQQQQNQSMHQLTQKPHAAQQFRPSGGQLPSQPIANPQNHPPGFQNQTNMVNGGFEEPFVPSQMEDMKAISQLRNGKEDDDFSDDEKVEKSKVQVNIDPKEYVSTTPFPHALKPKVKKGFMRNDELMKKFKEVQVKIPLLDAIKHVPSYAKFLKVAIILDQLPMKCKDPSAPLISCEIGGIIFDNALLDLGASVNLLPIVIAEHFRIGELKPASTILQFVDRSTKKPKGILEVVIIKVGECYFLVDFLVLDMTLSHELE